MRKLASIRRIKDIQPIEGADVIERITIDGWHCVSKKGEFTVDDLAVYFEIDSFLPASDQRFEFLKKSGVKKDPAGTERIRVRTVRLRKQISQGIALPLNLFPELVDAVEGDDVTEQLNVIKYERPEPKCTNAAGNFPSFIPKTDEERVQNIFDTVKCEYKGHYFLPTLKMDGSSMTVAFIHKDSELAVDQYVAEDKALPVDRGYIVVCSRNLQLTVDWNSHFWKALENNDTLKKILRLQVSYFQTNDFAVQGEVCGPGINGGREKLVNFRFFAFNLYDIGNQTYIPYNTAERQFRIYGVESVRSYNPVLIDNFDTVDDVLAYADGPSINNDNREGIVFKLSSTHHRPFSFKAISNRYLMEHKE